MSYPALWFCFLFIKIHFKNTLRKPHGQHSQIKLIIHDRNVIFKDHIILKLGQKYIRTVLFPIDLITDILINRLSGNRSWIAGAFDLIFNCLI